MRIVSSRRALVRIVKGSLRERSDIPTVSAQTPLVMAAVRQHRPIDKEFEEADYTGVLDISTRKLRLFPNIGDDVYDTSEIFTAILSGNRFDKFPKQILRCINLVTLNFHNNSLRTLPEEIASLKELKELNVSRNFLQALPASITSMKLQLLAVNNNRLAHLPSDIGQMKLLRSLDASCNDLCEIPPSLSDMCSLTYINLRRNEIRSLPEGLYKVPLTFLDVSANMLTRLPLALRHMNTLTVFHCANNPLEWPPAQICMRGINHVFKFLQEMEKYGSDPQQFAMSRDESLLRRRNKVKKTSRPISDASTLSGSGSDFGERSFVDEMTNIVQNAFGGPDVMLTAGTTRYWSQYSYEERSPYRHIRAREEQLVQKGRFGRSQSPGPTGRQPAVSSSQPGTHYGTLPRAGKDSTTTTTTTGGGGDMEEVSYRRHNNSANLSANRVSSPVFPSDRVLRAHSSEPNNVQPSAGSSDIHKDKSTKSADFMPPQSASTPTQQHISSHYHTTPHSSHHESSGDPQRPKTPPSREGSVTPTPGDLDGEEPSTPKEPKYHYPRPTFDELKDELESVSDKEKLASLLKIEWTGSIDDMYVNWLETNPNSTWKDIISVLRNMEEIELCKELETKFKLSPFTAAVESTPTSNDTSNTSESLTPQHQPAAAKQVSFSVDVSEIPRQSVSSEEDLDREQSLSPSTLGPPPQDSEDIVTEDDTEPESPLLSPSHPEKQKGPQTAPKPKVNKDKDKDYTSWPRQRAQGAPHKRKNDVFKVIGKQDPNFTVRRQQANIQQELEKIQRVKKDVEDILSTEIADDFGQSISDGVLLCQLVNKLYPNTISTIHVPKPNETLSAPKQTINVAAFLAACKKLGVPEMIVCSAGEILEYKDPIRVTACIRGLLDTVSV